MVRKNEKSWNYVPTRRFMNQFVPFFSFPQISSHLSLIIKEIKLYCTTNLYTSAINCNQQIGKGSNLYYDFGHIFSASEIIEEGGYRRTMLSIPKESKKNYQRRTLSSAESKESKKVGVIQSNPKKGFSETNIVSYLSGKQHRFPSGGLFERGLEGN